MKQINLLIYYTVYPRFPIETIANNKLFFRESLYAVQHEMIYKEVIYVGDQ